MELNNENYFSTDMQMEYMGASQFKSFLDCPARTMAEIKGEYERPVSKALLMGSYVDAFFSNEMDSFMDQHPEVFKKDGSLKADYLLCEKAIARASRDPLFMTYAMGGDHQTIMTGELFGSKYKIKMDAYHGRDKIVDVKFMKDIKPIYKDGTWMDFVSYWGYARQLYIYQQIEAQNSKDGRLLPCYLAVITKEEEPDLHLFEIPQWRLNSEAAVIEHYTPIFQAYKDGTKEPPRCENCAYCHRTKVLTKPEQYADLLEGDE